MIHDRAKSDPKSIVFAEADQLDIIKAAQIVYEEKIGIPILLGNKEIIQDLMESIDFEAEVSIIDPKKKNILKVDNFMPGPSGKPKKKRKNSLRV